MARALLEAALAVGLWSASPLLVQDALQHLTPAQIGGARYALAFLALAPLLIPNLRRLRSLPAALWLRLVAMGLLCYGLGNTLLFWGLETLSPTTVAFLLNGIPVLTVGLGARLLGERPNRWQALGIALVLLGALAFFGGGLALDQPLRLAGSLLGVAALAGFGVMNRQIARGRDLDVASLAALPLLFGALPLLALDPPPLDGLSRAASTIAWLGLVNSALAYLLWTHALRRLQAFEISVVGNLMPIGTALLAWALRAERLPPGAWGGMLLALGGVVLVGAAGRPPAPPVTPEPHPPEA